MAINFPSTAGQATDGSYTYTVAGITYSWNGSSWQAAGAGASATDRTLFSVTTNAAGSPALSYNNNTGVFSYTPPDISTFISAEADTLDTVTGRGASTANALSLTNTGTGLTLTGGTGAGRLDVKNAGAYAISLNASAGINTADGVGLYIGNIATNTWRAQIDGSTGQVTGGSFSTTGSLTAGSMTVGGLTYPTVNGNATEVLTSDGSGGITWAPVAGLQTRKTAGVTQSIANNTAANVSISTAKGFALYSIETSHAAWVTLYTDTNARTNDASRVETTDPTPGSGVLAEVITTGAMVQMITPGTICFNSGSVATTYAKIVNKSGSTANISVGLSYVQIEA